MITVWRHLPPRPESDLSGPVSSRTLAPRASCLRLCHVLSPEDLSCLRLIAVPPTPGKVIPDLPDRTCRLPSALCTDFCHSPGCTVLPSLRQPPVPTVGSSGEVWAFVLLQAALRSPGRRQGGGRGSAPHTRNTSSVLTSFWVFFWVLGVFKETLSYSEPAFHAGLFRAQICWVSVCTKSRGHQCPSSTEGRRRLACLCPLRAPLMFSFPAVAWLPGVRENQLSG